MPQKDLLKIGIVCGEHSGDMLGSNLISEIQKEYDVKLYGVGGPKLENIGLKSEFDFSKLNIMGLVDPLKKYFKISQLRKNLIDTFIRKDIDIFVGIDSPDFNMGIHKALKKKKSNKNIQLVSPSVWAWRQNRIKSIKKNIDLTICLFNFEDEFYKKNGLNSIHIGHPFSEIKKSDKTRVLEKYHLDKNKKYLSILPGSRHSEIKHMMPIFADFITMHSSLNPEYFYLIPAADKKLKNIIDDFLSDINAPAASANNAIRDFLSISDLSITTSGTATLESAILECPPIICYKTNVFNYVVISKMLKVDNIGLPNLLLGRRAYPELIQKSCTAKNILHSVEATQATLKDSKYTSESLRKLLKGVNSEHIIQAIREL
ncbi:MAG: lipid-A-disaccharide synthase [Gammaproteobacteria bacterium]|nr:lipid-A-disaccharide synthase [Gammaproteobacteria bacterium]